MLTVSSTDHRRLPLISSGSLTAHLDSALAAFLFKILEFHYFRHNEALLKVGVDLPCSLWSLSSFLSRGRKKRGQMNCFGEDGLQHASDMVFDRAIALGASLGGVFSWGYSRLAPDFWIAFHSAVPR